MNSVAPSTAPLSSATPHGTGPGFDVQAGQGARRPSSRLLLPTLWIVVAVVSLWVRSGFPVMALGGAGADDALFIRLAKSLIQGQWLGPYDNLTLAKGMFYPLFIAANALIGLPLKMAEQGVYLAVSAATAGYISRRSGRRWLGTVLFIVLAFNPALWDQQLARVIREGLYISLTLGVVALTVAVSFSSARLWRRALLGAGLGLVTGGFWLTREEGIWILPALATVVGLAVIGLVVAPPGTRRRGIIGLVIPLAVAAAVFAGANGIVALLNGHYYGNAVTTEFKSKSFQRAYGALAGINQNQWHRYVVFPRDARLRAYAVSPAARELEPFFDGEGGESWRRIGCDQSWMDKKACPEILAGWFMWALRDAVTAAGHTKSAKDASRFYKRLADEIDAACADGRLACLSSHRATLAPPFHWQYVGDALERSKDLASIVFTLGGGNLETPPSEGMQPELTSFADLAGPIAPNTSPVEQRITGWVAATSGMPSLAIQPGPGVTTDVQNIRSGQDIENGFPGMTAMRFELTTTCQPTTCTLAVGAPGMTTATLPWAKLTPGAVITTPGERLFVETVSSFDRTTAQTIRLRAQRWCARVIYPLYGYSFPILSGLGLIGLMIAAVVRRGVPMPLFALGAASLVAVICRIALLSYLDVTSIPSANSLYASPVSPFVILFSGLGLYAGGAALWRRRVAIRHR